MRLWIASPRDPRQTPLADGLRQSRVTLSAFDSVEAVEAALVAGLPDALLVDRTLPGAMGLVSRLREGGLAPELAVAVLGEDTVDERIGFFEQGADDVVPETIEARELLARLGRRRPAAPSARTATSGALAILDALTEVHNRRYFLLRLAEELRRAQRYDTPLALVVVDLDHFRGINEAAGHLAGDAVLRTAATRHWATARSPSPSESAPTSLRCGAAPPPSCCSPPASAWARTRPSRCTPPRSSSRWPTARWPGRSNRAETGSASPTRGSADRSGWPVPP